MGDRISETVERTLEAELSRVRESAGERLFDAMAHSLLGGGKRLRARLVLLFCDLYGGREEDALPLACAIEMIHAHSLIHDDLPSMDNADTRRGKPSCHQAFDEATALLAGDALLALAFDTVSRSLLSDGQKAEAIRLLSAGTLSMLVGQTMDKSYEDREIDLSTLCDLQRHKTGALIAAACSLGAVAASADGTAAHAYGLSLGRAFQITDDILDVTSTAEMMGKPVGNDSVCKKNTFVSLLGLQEAEKQADEQTERAVAALSSYGEKAEPLIALARSMRNRKN